MALREFTDPGGRTWRVWATIPTTPHEAATFAQSAELQADAERRGGSAPGTPRVSVGRENGWLTFEAGAEKRRLSPIPDGWDHAPEDELARWLDRAEPAHLGAGAARMLGQPPRGA
jgi:hypothetical protein